MDFFTSHMVIHGQSYQCKLSYDKRSLLIPFSELLVCVLFWHKTAVIDGDPIDVKGAFIVESMGFGGKDKLLKLKISWKRCTD
ncbi:hypothetical protein VV869_06345 [Photobacterium sp. MCCC 1A19761]|uniref:hypothetical protein n=1 Tax=Photobacterium sp. MCCC 1A19761 TaxID=3115000 RepID=UPI00307F941F